ncbi:MAG: hypothetical protein LC792_07420 [Actinobacteria bacterium]|nr:hypothetical protein [Actinomycetota bacterium]
MVFVLVDREATGGRMCTVTSDGAVDVEAGAQGEGDAVQLDETALPATDTKV